jgi:hypothetical protein
MRFNVGWVCSADPQPTTRFLWSCSFPGDAARRSWSHLVESMRSKALIDRDAAEGRKEIREEATTTTNQRRASEARGREATK